MICLRGVRRGLGPTPQAQRASLEVPFGLRRGKMYSPRHVPAELEKGDGHRQILNTSYFIMLFGFFFSSFFIIYKNDNG